MIKREIPLVILAVITVLLSPLLSQARTAPNAEKGKGGLSSAGVPAHCLAGHRIGRMVLGVNNNGTFGSENSAGSGSDCFTGEAVPNCEFPKGSNVEYLFTGAFWIGAVVNRDTLVSVGADGWQIINEFFPDESPFGDMIYRSIIDPSKPEYDGAVSEEDYIGTYSDTYTQGVPADAGDNGRLHRPINIEVTEASYAWSYSYAEDFVLFDYKIRNIGNRLIKGAYMGVYVDADVCFDCNTTLGFQDDICGFVPTNPALCDKCEYTNEVNIAWIADNNGDFTTENPAPHVTATRIVRTPADSLDVSFNWWVGNMDPSLDFGPREQSGKGKWKEEFRPYGTGGLGTPDGDRNKYYVMRNREFDYDQVLTSQITPSDTLWLYPNQTLAGNISDGFDTRYLLSFGPFDINPGDVLPISFAYLAGAWFHNPANPTNGSNLPGNPELFYNNLNFDSLAENSRWASWIYDNPGVDTDSDGFYGEVFVCVTDSVVADSVPCAGEPDCPPGGYKYLYMTTDSTVCFISGDGVPDFRGASPPPAPVKWLQPEYGQLKVRFNGFRSELVRDVFSDEYDFEGYRVYIGRDDRSSSFTLIASYDREDYNRYIWDDERPGGAGFSLLGIPFTLEELRCLYGTSCTDSTFDPLSYSRGNPFSYLDSLFYFTPQDYNASELGVSTKIKKIYPNQPYPTILAPELAPDSELTEDGYLKYFEYEITITDLLPTVPYWVNITAFDFGSPASGLPSLETSVTVGAINAYPLASVDEVDAKNLKVYVYPNPYRIDAKYQDIGYEAQSTQILKGEEYLRTIHFVNLPAQCTISIFSVDGDLVRKIEHNSTASSATAMHEAWDLITRNGQQVVSGLYYWTVESDSRETQIGKLVIIL